MRNKVFALGAILLIVGGYVSISTYTQLSQWGPLIALLDPGSYQRVQGLMFISILGALIGFVLLIYGASSRPKQHS
jgi:hypothetical protein